MCGFVGFLGPPRRAEDLARIAAHMAAAIAHRGPDDQGQWTDAEAGLALAHCRLSIQDLSPAGHQPMVSQSGRWIIVYNGELYNSNELRAKLEQSSGTLCWRGHSDTEILLAAIDMWGPTKALEGAVGMFAFAAWDRRDRQLILARDRLGEKPLYWGRLGQTFAFGSDLAAFRRHPDWQGTINRDALTLLLRHNYIPAPHSIYDGVYKLKPGSILTLDRQQHEPAISQYWSAHDEQLLAINNPFQGSTDEAAAEVERLLRQSIKGQIISDVPLGAFLSGGIDSSTVVALMQSMSAQPVKTFTIGFDAEGYDEAKHAKAIARHLGTDHTELYVTTRDALDAVPKLSSVYSEPFSDSSQIPTYLVSKLARSKVTVSVSGDGGDELFCGYSRYAVGDQLWRRLQSVPLPARKLAARALQAVRAETWNAIAKVPMAALPTRFKRNHVGQGLHKLAGIMTLKTSDDAYRSLVSHWLDPAAIVIGGTEPETELTSGRGAPKNANAIRQMMQFDLVSYLPDDILVKVDRASMAVSLESRVPMLDHRLVEFAMRLPLTILNHQGRSKWPLRDVLEKYVPRTLFERPKMGFGVPLDSWLRGPLRDWAEALLDEGRLRQEGFFDPTPIRHAWSEHQSQRQSLQYPLWDVLMFQAWLAHERDAPISPGQQ